MPSTSEQVLEAAKKLGQLIAEHPASARYKRVIAGLRDDLEAQRLLTDYTRFMNGIAEKEAMGRPIEVEDKRKLERLQGDVATNLKLRELQMAQVEYADLMRRVDGVISSVGGGGSGTGGGSGGGGAPTAVTTAAANRP